MVDKVRRNEIYAQNLYAAFWNREFASKDVWGILSNVRWNCSWRYAAAMVAEIHEQSDYLDWYCSGIGSGLGNGDEDGTKGYVPESVVTEEIEQDLLKLGWKVVQDQQDQNL